MWSDRNVSVVNPEVTVQPMASGAILLNTVTGDCFELNGLGASIWDRLLKGEYCHAIVAALALQYDVPNSTVESDVDNLLTELSRHGLLLPVGR